MKNFFSVRDYQNTSGASNDPDLDWTNAFQCAVTEAKRAGGGIIFVPPGIYKTRSIQLYSNMTLYLSAGAKLEFSECIQQYDTIRTEFEGIPMESYMPCIYARNANHVAVKGEGCMDGKGKVWWDAFHKGTLKKARPYLICFQECTHVMLEGVTLENSPCWTVHTLYCKDVTIQKISIHNPADSPNTDGIDPNGCQHVRILDCLIDVGDDCIALKSGTEQTPDPRPCENICIANCIMLHGHGGIVMGSEMSGDVRNVIVSNCIFQKTDRGLRIKTRRRRGGKVENIHLQNCIMEQVGCPFVINMYYFCGKNGKERYVWDKNPYPVDDTTPMIRNIHIQHVTVKDAAWAAGFIYGLKEMPVEDISLSQVSITMDQTKESEAPAMMDGIEKTKAAGFYMRNGKNISFHHVNIYNTLGNEIDSENVYQDQEELSWNE